MTITFIFCLLLGRFFYIQVVWDSTLRALALDQWTREIPVKAERGLITDRNGVVLADNQKTYAVYVRLRAVKNKNYTASVLSKVLSLDEGKLLDKFEKTKVSEIKIAQNVEKNVINTLSFYDLPGVYYARDNLRNYVYGDQLCQTLGFISADGNGVSGIEKYYHKYLCGTDGEILYDTDLVGVDLKGAVGAYIPSENGMNVELTIDLAVQASAERVMKKVYSETQALGVRCIVMDPNDFSILALVNYPSYDLNAVPREDGDLLNALTRNRVVSDIYEPGSTFKIITAAMTIEEYYKGNPSAPSLTHVYPSSRTRFVDGTTIKCWSSHENGKHSNQTLREALNNSCNPCFVDMALSLGKETFYEYLSLYRFGKETGIDFSGEAIGMLIPEGNVRDCDLARIGFGQTVAVTPLQLALSVAASVNGGYYYSPHLVNRIYSADRSVEIKTEKKLISKTVSEKASRTLAEMLEGVISDGSGKKAYIEGYKVGGKTGTAQKYENGVIAQGKYISSFVGFFPSDAPKYLALVIVDEPQGQYYGSIVAAPCAKEIFEDIIRIKNIMPYE